MCGQNDEFKSVFGSFVLLLSTYIEKDKYTSILVKKMDAYIGCHIYVQP